MSSSNGLNKWQTGRERGDATMPTFSVRAAEAPLLFTPAVPQVRERSVNRRQVHTHQLFNYGTIQDSRRVLLRSSSMPVPFTRIVCYRKQPRQLTVGQQSARLAEKARKNFFHGSFTSAHGAVFTVPNRAQQMATNRPSCAAVVAHPSVSRNTSAAAKQVPPVFLDAVPASSAMKTSVSPSAIPDLPGSEDICIDTPVPEDRLCFTKEPIMLPRRAMSAGARLGEEHHCRVVKNTVSKLSTTVRVGDPLETQRATMALNDSSPDLLAVQLMRDRSASQKRRVPLSPTTISRAVRALRAFEERKVRLPSGSFSNAREVLCGSGVIPVPDHSPLVLATSKRIESPARVKSGIFISDAVEKASTESETDIGESEEDIFASRDSISWCGAVMDLLYLAAPAAVSICFTFSMSVIPLAFVGSYLGPRQLTGASVGYFLISILITYPMIGLTFALDTLCSHEYGRNPLSTEMGLVLQRGAFINLIMLFPLCTSIYFLGGILVPLYGELLAKEAGDFLTYSPLYLVPMVLFIAMNKFLNNQMQPHIPMIALTAGVMITPFLQAKLTPMGVRYTMVGMAITAWFQLALVMIITILKPETRITLGKWRIAEALHWPDVKEYMKLAIPSAIFVAAEASSFDITVLMCARFGEMDGAAWSGIMNCLFIFASFSGGLSASACANIGRCIGAYQPVSARRFVLVSIVIAFVLGVIDSAVLFIIFDQLMSLFGTHGKTLALAREVLYLLPVFHVCDAVQFTFQGIFSGMGKNHLGAVILLTSLWGVGIPLAFVLGELLGYRMFGVCVGITVGLCIEAPTMVYAASTINYVAVCEKFMEDEEEDEEDEEEETEESEDSEAYEGVCVEEVMRRSGISMNSTEVTEGNTEHYRKLLPPRRCRRYRPVVEYRDEDD
ncbi:hypothetical protein JKF63_03241 [Porcisia hertigi]|uniref:Multidrug and toxin extrusion protein n=1 Tax=Porcisia hertigi TaxID=2761500 RepID=A0A836LH88_9TRYP|nr:hypothetical protein JKF63_03241 [Porcisia hertigi]